jgi:hypothetical protein
MSEPYSNTSSAMARSHGGTSMPKRPPLAACCVIGPSSGRRTAAFMLAWTPALNSRMSEILAATIEPTAQTVFDQFGGYLRHRCRHANQRVPGLLSCPTLRRAIASLGRLCHHRHMMPTILMLASVKRPEDNRGCSLGKG